MGAIGKSLTRLGVLVVVMGAAAQAWAVSTWTVQSSPNVTAVNDLDAVSATSSTNAWAAGSYLDASNIRRTLIEHYDGATWVVQTSPNIGSADNQLSGAKATSSTNAWAVGSFVKTSTGLTRTLIEHYDGVGWTHQVSSNYTNANNALRAVAATSSSNAFAVGDTMRPNSICGVFGSIDPRPVIEHYDGAAWKMMKSPNPTYDADSLHGVTTLSSTSAWAVGCQGNVDGNSSVLVEHYNGTKWVTQHAVDGVRTYNQLESVSARSSSDVWAVGWTGDTQDFGVDDSYPLIEHYDGTTWTYVNPPFLYGRLYSVKATSATNVWAVGYWIGFPSIPQQQPLIIHWDGSTWSVQAQLSIGSFDTSLHGVGATSSTNAFTVGTENTIADGSTSNTLVLHCC